MALARTDALERLDQTTIWVEDNHTLPPAQNDYLAPAVLLRSPVVVGNPSWRSDAVPASPPAAGVNSLTANRTLGVRDVLLHGEILRRFNRAGCPTHGWVPISLNEAADAMGYRGKGSRQRALAWEAEMRLRHTSLTWTEWGTDGRRRLLDFDLYEAIGALEDGQTGMRLSQTSREMVEHTTITHLRHETAKALVAADEVAAHLWLFLESERQRDQRRGESYRLFRVSPGEEPAEGYARPVIAEVLGLNHWQKRRQVAWRVARAIDTIHRIDGDAYRLNLEHVARTGMYTFTFKRSKRPRPKFSTAARAHVHAGTPEGGYSEERRWVLRGTGGGYSEERGVGTARNAGGYSEERGVGTARNATSENPLQNEAVSEPHRLVYHRLVSPSCLSPSIARAADDRVRETSSSKEDQEQEHRSAAPSPSGDSTAVAIRSEGDTSFAAFWDAYPRREGQKEAHRLWKRLTAEQQHLATAVAQVMGPLVAAGRKEIRYVPSAVTFLRDERWEDWRDGPPASWQNPGAQRLADVLAAAAAAYGPTEDAADRPARSRPRRTRRRRSSHDSEPARFDFKAVADALRTGNLDAITTEGDPS